MSRGLGELWGRFEANGRFDASGIAPCRVSRGFLFDREKPQHSTLVSPVRDAVKRFSSGALWTVCRRPLHGPKFLQLTLRTPPARYSVRSGSSAIRPSTAPRRRRLRCPSLGTASSTAHVSPAVLASSPAVAADSSATSSRPGHMATFEPRGEEGSKG